MFGRVSSSWRLWWAIAGVIPPPANATDVCGTISSNTTWTAAASPYIVTCDVILSNDAILTIEQGVEVRFDLGMGLRVGWAGVDSLGGALVADASAGAPILFTSNAPIPSPGDWSGVWLVKGASASVLDNCMFEYAAVSVRLYGARASVRNCDVRLSGNIGIDIRGDYASQDTISLTGCTVADNEHLGVGIGGLQPRAVLSGCRIENNRGGGVINYSGQGPWIVLEDCVVLGNRGWGGVIIRDGVLELQDTEIHGNVCDRGPAGFCPGGGVSAHSIRMRCCSVTENGSLSGTGGVALSSGVITSSNIANNPGLELTALSSPNISTVDVWWGTTDPAEIAAAIYDCQDNPARGCVATGRFLAQPVTPGNCPKVSVRSRTWTELKRIYR